MLWRCVNFLPVPYFPLKHIFTAPYLFLRIGSECSCFDLLTLRSKVVSPATLHCWQKCLSPLGALWLTNLSVLNGHKIWFTAQALTLLTLGKVCQPCGGCRQRLLSSFPSHPFQDKKQSMPQFTNPKGQGRRQKQLHSHSESHETRTQGHDLV